MFVLQLLILSSASLCLISAQVPLSNDEVTALRLIGLDLLPAAQEEWGWGEKHMPPPPPPKKKQKKKKWDKGSKGMG